MTKRVFEENGGFTKEASELADKVRSTLRNLIREELDDGTPMEVLEYVINNTAHIEVLTQQLHIRLGKDKEIIEDLRGE